MLLPTPGSTPGGGGWVFAGRLTCITSTGPVTSLAKNTELCCQLQLNISAMTVALLQAAVAQKKPKDKRAPAGNGPSCWHQLGCPGPTPPSDPAPGPSPGEGQSSFHQCAGCNCCYLPCLCLYTSSKLIRVKQGTRALWSPFTSQYSSC